VREREREKQRQRDKEKENEREKEKEREREREKLVIFLEALYKSEQPLDFTQTNKFSLCLNQLEMVFTFKI
jgi:hypothetical protein